MTYKAREEAVEKFKDDPEMKIMIASLKCGGIGLVSVMRYTILNFEDVFTDESNIL